MTLVSNMIDKETAAKALGVDASVLTIGELNEMLGEMADDITIWHINHDRMLNQWDRLAGYRIGDAPSKAWFKHQIPDWVIEAWIDAYNARCEDWDDETSFEEAVDLYQQDAHVIAWLMEGIKEQPITKDMFWLNIGVLNDAGQFQRMYPTINGIIDSLKPGEEVIIEGLNVNIRRM